MNIFDALRDNLPVQRLFQGEWKDCTRYQALCMLAEGWDLNLRAKPTELRIGELLIPEPLRAVVDKVVFITNLIPGQESVAIKPHTFVNIEPLLKAGIVHATREAANLHAQALRSFTQC